MSKLQTCLVSAIILGAHVASAQLQFGLVAGGSSSTISSHGLGRFNGASIAGFAGGVTAQIPLWKNVSFAPEILFATKGGRERLLLASTGDGPIPSVYATTSLGYFEIPVLLRMTFGSGTLRPFVTAGGQADFRTGCNIKIAYTGFESNAPCSSQTLYTESGVKAHDVGAVLGAGVVSSRASFTLRYDLGVLNTSNNYPGTTAKNRSVVALFGISR